MCSIGLSFYFFDFELCGSSITNQIPNLTSNMKLKDFFLYRDNDKFFSSLENAMHNQLIKAIL